MESVKYHKLSDLPEPDYFEIELEKIYGAPPTRLERLRNWARRNIYLVSFLALFLVAAILYISAKTAAKPMLRGILRPDTSQLKQAALADQVPDGLWAAPPPDAEPKGDHIMLDLSEPDTVVPDRPVVLSPPSNNSTSVMVSPEDADKAQENDSKKPIENHQDPGQESNQSTAAQPTASKVPAKPTPAAEKPAPRPKPSDKPVVQEDTGKVAIQEPTPEEKEPYVPIRATFFSSVEGPKSCRGHPVAVIDLPKPAGLGVPSAKQCFNFAKETTSGCALFMANKVDGCVASVYAETNCRTYTNTVAFMPEERPVGGLWRSVMLQCGVPEPDPATLGQPPMMDQMTSMVDNTKAGGKG